MGFLSLLLVIINALTCLIAVVVASENTGPFGIIATTVIILIGSTVSALIAVAYNYGSRSLAINKAKEPLHKEIAILKKGLPVVIQREDPADKE